QIQSEKEMTLRLFVDVLPDGCGIGAILHGLDQVVVQLRQHLQALHVGLVHLADVGEVGAQLCLDLRAGHGRRMDVVGVLDPSLQPQRSEDAEHDHQIVLGEIPEGFQSGVRRFDVHGGLRQWRASCRAQRIARHAASDMTCHAGTDTIASRSLLMKHATNAAFRRNTRICEVTMSLKVCLAGATGWAGSELARGIAANSDLELVAAVSRRHAGQPLGTALGDAAITTPVFASAAEALAARCDVFVEYTHPDTARANILAALEHGAHVVVGTSGLTDEDYARIDVV